MQNVLCFRMSSFENNFMILICTYPVNNLANAATLNQALWMYMRGDNV